MVSLGRMWDTVCQEPDASLGHSYFCGVNDKHFIRRLNFENKERAKPALSTEKWQRRAVQMWWLWLLLPSRLSDIVPFNLNSGHPWVPKGKQTSERYCLTRWFNNLSPGNADEEEKNPMETLFKN